MNIKAAQGLDETPRKPRLGMGLPTQNRSGSDECAAKSAAFAEKNSPPPALSKRILVVDNEPASTRMVRLTLERSGLFEVCEINDPRAALATAHRFQPHLVLLDIEMPGLDGSGVARQFREDQYMRNLPILFMTSLVTPEEADRRLYAAGSRVLAKPVTISRLLQSVAEMLGNILATGAPLTPALPV